MYNPIKLYVPQAKPNEHLKKIVDFFGELNAQKADIPIHLKFIFLCFTNRSGSNFLAELLASDGTLPLAQESLNFDTVISNSKAKNFKTFQEYFGFLSRRTSKNGFTIIKTAPAHLEVLGQSGILDQLRDRSSFIVIERGDKLAQAISHLIAFQTGKFMSTITETAMDAEPTFNRTLLNNIIANISDSYSYFNVFFARNGIAPGRVVYEHLAFDPEFFIEKFGATLGLPSVKVNLGAVRLERQASETNQRWREIYLSGHP